jgi:replicative DNA helicase
MAENSNDDDYTKEMRDKVREEETKLVNNGAPKILSPLTWEDASIKRHLEIDPPKQDFLFDGTILRNIVYGVFAAGGTSKTFLLLQLATCLATGRNLGPFKPTRTNKVFYMGAEDPDWELHRRDHLIADDQGLLHSKELAENLAVYTAVGKIGPLLKLGDNNNPTTTEYYDWLRKSIENLGCEVLILDPMSRLYGLNENDNAHGTAWIQALERLALDYKLSIIFAHHEPKSASQNKSLQDSKGRGASSIRDGCRGAISMQEMTESDGNKFDVNHRDYVEVDITKANYTAKLPSSIYFKRGEGGILKPVNLLHDRVNQITELLINELTVLPEDISRADLQLKRGLGKDVIDRIKESFPSINHKNDIVSAINYALENGLLYEIKLPTKGKPKVILKVRIS